MKKLLVLYYSQSGQLRQILDATLKPVIDSGEVELVYEQIQPEHPYPFPWKMMTFIDAMPESVKQIPCRLKPFQFDPNADYDAVILAYQVWYLSPSIPINSFLQSREAAQVMRNKPVITIIGCRNMWMNAHEIVKKRIVGNGGIPSGNIALIDRAANMVSIATIMYWMLTGRKERFLNVFPKPGVDDDDIRTAARFGHEIYSALIENRWHDLQKHLKHLGAVYINPSFIIMEQRIAKVFNIWAQFIRRKGGPGVKARKPRLRLFIGYLLTAIIILAPVAAGLTFILSRFSVKKIKQLTSHYADNLYKADTQ